ncbi:hypothetical protein PVAND_010217 [Polypedilum vanderplanki]|uniref:BTB domain-containing protein n=1 Tax=Polypedilum vanderplanki TaxID=319348 RepID=A0A9J6CFP6_POLVA|nr:hypothetical protein PVAND_010217 [Polypedilum vanderplanki]
MEEERGGGTESDLKMLSNETKFNDRFYRLRKINKFTDCSFKIQNRVLNCHKLILSAASPVFEAMMYGSFSHDMTNSILITDISYETFELFMNFIYTGELQLKENNEIECLVEMSYCAQKYLIDELRNLCIDQLTKMINRENVFKFLQNSFDRHLEDFLMSCLYFFVDSLETGTSFCNTMLNNSNSNHLSSQCIEFLAKNLIDYFGEREEVLCLIKAWTIRQCHVDRISPTVDSTTTNTKLLNLDNSLYSKITKMKAGFFDVSADKISKSFLRVYYKPIRQLIIDHNQMSFDVNISFKRFVTIKSFTINSRLVPEQHDFCDMSKQTYTEKLTIEILDKNSNESIYKQHHTIDNVTFNESFKIKFNERMILFPYHIYIVKIQWNEDSIGFEYPRAIFSLIEKANDEKLDDNGNPLSIVQFHEYNYCYNFPFGSIVQGINYDVIL